MSQPTVPQAPFDSAPPSGVDRMREMLSDRRALAIIGAAVIAVVALVAFVVVPGLSGSSSSASKKPLVTHPVTSAVPTPSPSATGGEPTTSPAALKVRDPLSPLVAAANAGGAVTAGAPAPGSGALTPGVNDQPAIPGPVVQLPGAVVTVPGPEQTVTVTSTPTPAPTQSTVKLTEITLLKINNDSGGKPVSADVEVNGVPYPAVTLNTPFSKSFVMTALTADNATFVFNEQTVTIVPGEFGLFEG